LSRRIQWNAPLRLRMLCPLLLLIIKKLIIFFLEVVLVNFF
jgi:hypothetical protein